MTVAEIADEAVLSEKTTQGSLDELSSIGFLRQGLDGTYEIERFKEKTSSDSAAAVRKARQRNRDRGVTVTPSSHAAEEEEEREVDSGATRPRPVCDCVTNPFIGREGLTAEEIVDGHFIATFARAKLPSAVDKARPKWLGWIRLMLDAGYSAAEIWAASAVTHNDARHGLIVQSVGIWASLKRIRPAAVPGAVSAAVQTIAKADRK